MIFDHSVTCFYHNFSTSQRRGLSFSAVVYLNKMNNFCHYQNRRYRMKKLTFPCTPLCGWGLSARARARARGRRSARRLPQDGGRRASPPDFESKQCLSIFGALHVRVPERSCSLVRSFIRSFVHSLFCKGNFHHLYFRQSQGVKWQKWITWGSNSAPRLAAVFFNWKSGIWKSFF